jgi:hypothetical protein
VSTLNTIANAIVSVITAADPDVGKVSPGNPDIGRLTMEHFVEQFVIPRPGDATRGQIRYWAVAYAGESAEYRFIAFGASKKAREVNWLVRFWMSWDDVSEPVFRDLVEAVTLAIDTNKTLLGTVVDHDACAVSLPNQGMGMVLGDYGCHAAEIRFRTLDEINLATQ